MELDTATQKELTRLYKVLDSKNNYLANLYIELCVRQKRYKEWKNESCVKLCDYILNELDNMLGYNPFKVSRTMKMVKPTVKDEGKYWWLRANFAKGWEIVPVVVAVMGDKISFYMTIYDEFTKEEELGKYEFVCPCSMPPNWERRK